MRGKDRTQKEFDELLLEVRKVTRVNTGWRQMSFRAIVAIGNKKWKVGVWVSKWPDVTSAIQKASREAYKSIFEVPLTKANTVPYIVEHKYKSCIVRLLPASQGTGLKAGSSVRSILELAWYDNVLSKIIWSNNKLNNALATIRALSAYKHADHFNGLVEKKAEVVEDKKEAKKVEKKDDTKKKTVTKKTKTTKKESTKEDVKKVEKTEKKETKKDSKEKAE